MGRKTTVVAGRPSREADVREHFRHWLTVEASKTVSESTAKTYVRIIGRMLPKTLPETDPEHMSEELRVQLAEKGLRVLKKSITPRTPQGTRVSYNAAVKRWLMFLGVEAGEAKKHVTRTVPVRRLNAGELTRKWKEGLTPDELRLYRSVVAECRAPQRTILLMLPETGLRISEACGLEREDIEKRTARGKTVWGLSVLGKGNKERWVPLNNTANRLLVDHVRAWEMEHGSILTGPLFRVASSDLSISPESVRRELREARKRLGGSAQRVTPHLLRHTYAKRLLDRKTPLTVIQRLLGHSSLNTTAGYLQPGAGDLQDAVVGLDNPE